MINFIPSLPGNAGRKLGDRAAELTEKEEVQKKMLEILQKESKEAAEKWVYSLAIATLCITPKEFEQYVKEQAAG